MILRVLHPDGRRLVVPELATGERERWEEDAYAGLLREHPSTVGLDAFDDAIDRVMRDGAAHDPGLDAEAAPAVHRALAISRRDAADPGIFRYLAVVHRPDFVRFRWEYRSWPTMRSRFWRPGTRPDSNVFARLWWIAELSRDGDDYETTRRLLTRQPLANNLFVRDLAAYAPLVRAYTSVLEDAPAWVIEGCVRVLQRRLSTVVLESLDAASLEAQLRDIRRRVEGD